MTSLFVSGHAYSALLNLFKAIQLGLQSPVDLFYQLTGSASADAANTGTRVLSSCGNTATQVT